MSTPSLRFRWEGELPRVGQFLKAPRGRTAYEIVAIRSRPGDHGDVGTFKVARWTPSEVPPEATVHPWQWDKR